MHTPTIGQNQCHAICAIRGLTKSDGLFCELLWKNQWHGGSSCLTPEDTAPLTESAAPIAV